MRSNSCNINFLNRHENKASKVFKNSKNRNKFVSKTLFVFNVFIVCLPELDEKFADCDTIYGN